MDGLYSALINFLTIVKYYWHYLDTYKTLNHRLILVTGYMHKQYAYIVA